MKPNLLTVQALGGFFGHLLSPSTWRRPVIDRIARQIIFSGVDALPLLIVLGIGIGALATTQGELWLKYTKRPDYLYSVVNAGIVREVAPLLTVLLALPLNGAPMCAELSMMKVSREVQTLRCQGVSVFLYLVFPRMFGLAMACACGTLVLATTAFLTCSIGLTGLQGDAAAYGVLRRFLLELEWRDVVWMLVKASSGGLLIATVASVVGLSAGDATTEVPRMVSRSMTLAMGWVIGIWFVLTAGGYVL